MKGTRIYLCVTLFCGAISGPVLAQRTAFALSESASSRQTVRGTIVDVIFAERRSNGKVELYPRVIFYKDKIVEFFNDQGRLISSMPYGEYYQSPGGSFIGLQRRQDKEMRVHIQWAERLRYMTAAVTSVLLTVINTRDSITVTDSVFQIKTVPW